MLRDGRVTLQMKSGKTSCHCENCGGRDATMIELGFSSVPGENPNFSLTLCITCNSHLSGVLKKHEEFMSCGSD